MNEPAPSPPSVAEWASRKWNVSTNTKPQTNERNGISGLNHTPLSSMETRLLACKEARNNTSSTGLAKTWETPWEVTRFMLLYLELHLMYRVFWRTVLLVGKGEESKEENHGLRHFHYRLQHEHCTWQTIRTQPVGDIELAPMFPGDSTVSITSQLPDEWHHVSSAKLAIVGVCAPWKLPNASSPPPLLPQRASC